MPFAKNNKISLRQMQALLFLEVLGFGVLVAFPNIAGRLGHAGWVAVILSLGVALLLTLLMSSLGSRFQGLSFQEFCSKLLGKPIGALVCAVFFVRLAILASVYLNKFAEVVKITMLPNTPNYVVIIAIVALCGYGASKGIETRGRVAELLVLIAVLPLVFAIAILVRGADFSNLLPIIIHTNPQDIGIATFHGIFAFNGLEFILLMAPFVANPKNMRKSAVKIVLTMGIFMVAITTLAIARFGQSINNYTNPILKMLDTISFPGTAVDRQGAFIMAFWVISAYAIINACLFFAAEILKDMAKKEHNKRFLWPCMLLVVVLALVPRDFYVINMMLGVATMAAIPFILLIAKALRKKRGF
ncbi:MAG: spore germination protein [Defluviitaleaceae bacterium]|nr:spore germination protein [Defluviitaleaceae bacterium]